MLTDLITLATRHGSRSGAPTIMPRLAIRLAERPTDPAPALFEPKFYLLLQGAKRMTIGGESFACDSGTCAVASVGLPFTSEVIEPSVRRPYLGIELKLVPGIVANLLLDPPERRERRPGTIAIARADQTIVEPLGRLLRLLAASADIPVLASQAEPELCYRLLQGPMGSTLGQIGRHNARFDQVKTAAEWICRNAGKPMCVKTLAASIGMSVTSFHRQARR
jgi:hypothetical protein